MSEIKFGKEVRPNNVCYWFDKDKHKRTGAACFSAWSRLTGAGLETVSYKMQIPKNNFTDEEIELFCSDMDEVFGLEAVYGEIKNKQNLKEKVVTISLKKNKQATFAFCTALRYMQEMPDVVTKYLLFRDICTHKIHALYMAHCFFWKGEFDVEYFHSGHSLLSISTWQLGEGHPVYAGFLKKPVFVFTGGDWFNDGRFHGIQDRLKPTILVPITLIKSDITKEGLITMAINLGKEHKIIKEEYL